MKKKLALLVTALMLMVTWTQAQPGNANRGPKFNQENPNYCRIPGLTDEQKQNIEKLRVAHMKEMQNYRVKMMQLRAELREMYIADKPDQNAINKKIDEISALKSKMMKAVANHRLKVRALLNDEQKVYFDAMPRKGMGNCGMGPGHGPRMGRGYYCPVN
ncbi:MAG: periplasmic heavy metal sensor [Bacteroidetes bacterium]|nr:MAG: periplasmic heavy metal sensor [Bacteroidota bacterium]